MKNTMVVVLNLMAIIGINILEKKQETWVCKYCGEPNNYEWLDMCSYCDIERGDS